MLYNRENLPNYVRTAGKITILTALSGLAVFIFALVFDFGTHELSKATAANGAATTTLTVLNTPPEFTVGAYEVIESSTSSPTNSGDTIQWSAVGTDTNGAPYFLLICSTNASPTANAASPSNQLGSSPPSCGGGTRWGVSASTTSGALATVSTTTTELAPFGEVNQWFAWVCDDDPTNPRCNSIPVQGLNATNSSPFNVNKRPVLTAFGNNGPKDPGSSLTFFSTSSDPDSNVDNDIYLVVCNNTSYSTTTNTCGSGFIASTTISMKSDASATTTLAAILQDDVYPAYAYIVDQYGHEATANGMQQNFTVNNVAPTVIGGDIDLNDGGNLILTVEAGETPSSTLDFTIRDANSCENASSDPEIEGYTVVVYRDSFGTTTCDGTLGAYDPNYCYSSGVPTTTWNLSCTATSTCSGPTQDYVDYACTFPLWFVADPTDNGVNTPPALETDIWTAAVSGTDDNSASGPLVETDSPVDLDSFPVIGILSAEIVYGSIEPASGMTNLTATSTAQNLGNTGIDQQVRGASMCGTYSISTPCAPSATSTIPEDQQKFASTSLTYADVLAQTLSSTTWKIADLNIGQSQATSTYNEEDTYWGIYVPGSITLAGSYTGMNSYLVEVSDPGNW